MKPVASDLAGLLEAAGLSLSRASGNLFNAPLPHGNGSSVAHKAVSVVLAGGSRPQAFMGGGKQAYRFARCLVTTRSPVEDFEAGQTLANACLEALNLATHANYLKISVQDSVANYLPPTNSNGLHFWVFNVVAEWVETPT